MPETRWLIITPRRFDVSVVVPDRDVGIRLEIDHETTGFLEGTELAIRMTPTEARMLARMLDKTADAAEAGVPRA
jgi:hypothetical protein